MKIKTLTLNNFLSFKSLDLNLKDSIILGKNTNDRPSNGAGKDFVFRKKIFEAQRHLDSFIESIKIPKEKKH